MFGELIPIGGGDPVPLLKKKLLIGRRESCDIVLRFANVSAHHCELTFDGGYLYVRDLQSRNGIKVNDIKVSQKRVDPGDTLCVAKHRYEVMYSPADLGAIGPPPTHAMLSSEVVGESLLSRAGLEKKDFGVGGEGRGSRRYDPTTNKAGQIKDPNKPV